MLVVGQKEIDRSEVGVRSRQDGDIGAMGLQEFVNKVEEEIKNHIK